MGWGFTLLTWARSQRLPCWVALARAPLPESHSWSVKQRYAHVGWVVGSPVAWPVRQEEQGASLSWQEVTPSWEGGGRSHEWGWQGLGFLAVLSCLLQTT